MPAERLALLRILVGLFALWYNLDRYTMYIRVANTSSRLFDQAGIVKLLNQPLSAYQFEYLLIVTIILNIFFVLGVKHKISGPIFAFALLFLMCYRNSWSNIYHNYNSLVLTIMVLGITPAADRLSFDCWMAKRKRWLDRGSIHWKYGWPIMLICLLTVLSYFLAGSAKILGELKWEWVDGSAMRSQVAVDALRKDLLGKSGTTLFKTIYPYTWLFTILGITTIIAEIGAPLVLLNSKVAKVWAVITWGMHWGIYFLMDIHFPYHLCGFIFLPFFPIEKIWFYIHKKLSVLPARPT